jgi:hypothetical protein
VPAGLAPAQSFEVQAELASSNETIAEAKENLAIQHQASRVDLAGQLEEELGENYASVWFDNDAGEFVVPVATSGDGQASTTAAKAVVKSEFSSAALGDDVRTEAVRYSTEELEAAQDDLSKALAPLLGDADVRSAIDPENNAVEIRVPSDLSAESLAEIEGVAREAGVDTELVSLEPRALEAGPAGCDEARRRTGRDLFGGISSERLRRTQVHRDRGPLREAGRESQRADQLVMENDFGEPTGQSLHWQHFPVPLPREGLGQNRRHRDLG